MAVLLLLRDAPAEVGKEELSVVVSDVKKWSCFDSVEIATRWLWWEFGLVNAQTKEEDDKDAYSSAMEAMFNFIFSMWWLLLDVVKKEGRSSNFCLLLLLVTAVLFAADLNYYYSALIAKLYFNDLSPRREVERDLFVLLKR